jgi:ketol-acid reductoisomerase
VVLISPTGPGSVLRALRERGESLPGYLAVHLDRSGSAWDLAEEYAERLGCSPVWRTTVREETEVDLFGEQAVLCGGLNALVTAAFETLVGRGYAPEMAYLECVHQLEYLARLLHERGMAGLRRSISATALYGDLTRGPRVVSEETRRELEAILEEIRSGVFAREWAAEVAGGKAGLTDRCEQAARHPLEEARRRVLEAWEEPT